MDQTKFLTILSGSIYDVVVDLRTNSPTFKQWRAFELSAEKKTQLVVPRGFGHGFCTLSDNTMVHYKVDNHYSTDHNKGIKWDDSELNIEWPTQNPILSRQDNLWPSLKEASIDFF
jgi:dTDP-4-dehydrorhamnose 3,5-epimerase